MWQFLLVSSSDFEIHSFIYHYNNASYYITNGFEN